MTYWLFVVGAVFVTYALFARRLSSTAVTGPMVFVAGRAATDTPRAEQDARSLDSPPDPRRGDPRRTVHCSTPALRPFAMCTQARPSGQLRVSP